MQIIQIGSIAILLKWLLLGLGVLCGLGFMKLWLRRFPKEENDKIFNLLTNTLFIGFLIWKGSLVLFEPTLVMKSFFSLLYFTGGSNGLVLATTFSIIFFIFKARRSGINNLIILQTVFMFGLVVTCIYQFLSLIFNGDNNVNHSLLGFVAIMILLVSLFNRNALTAKRIFSHVIFFSFIYLILSFVCVGMAQQNFFLFSANQWFYIGLIVFSVFYWDKEFPS
jgi:hypothetical protein